MTQLDKIEEDINIAWEEVKGVELHSLINSVCDEIYLLLDEDEKILYWNDTAKLKYDSLVIFLKNYQDIIQKYNNEVSSIFPIIVKILFNLLNLNKINYDKSLEDKLPYPNTTLVNLTLEDIQKSFKEKKVMRQKLKDEERNKTLEEMEKNLKAIDSVRSRVEDKIKWIMWFEILSDDFLQIIKILKITNFNKEDLRAIKWKDRWIKKPLELLNKFDKSNIWSDKKEEDKLVHDINIIHNPLSEKLNKVYIGILWFIRTKLNEIYVWCVDLPNSQWLQKKVKNLIDILSKIQEKDTWIITLLLDYSNKIDKLKKIISNYRECEKVYQDMKAQKNKLKTK